LRQPEAGLFTVAERNNENTLTARTVNVVSPPPIQPGLVVGELKAEKPRILSTKVTADSPALKGSQIFRSSQLHPSIQITYENSRTATNASDIHAANDTTISFAKVESNLQLLSPSQSNFQPQAVGYGQSSYPAAEAILSSQ